MAGNRFPILIFLSSNIVIPIAIISIPPIADISVITSGVKKSFMEFDKSVIDPW